MNREIPASRLLGGAACVGLSVAFAACTLTTPLDGLSGGVRDAGGAEAWPDALVGDSAVPEASSEETSADSAVDEGIDHLAADAGDEGLPFSCDAGFSQCGNTCIATASDPANCGACGHDCLGGGCQDGACLPRVLASGQEQPLWIALDSESVYWTNRAEGTVAKVSKSGGAVTQLAAGQAEPERIAVDSTGVYWTNRNDGTVKKVPLEGSAEPVVIAAGGGQCSGIALDDTYVYFADEGLDNIRRALKTPSQNPGTAEVLVSMQDGAKTVLVEGGNLYWSNGVPDGGAVRMRSLPDGPIIDLALAQQGAHDLAYGGEYVYWTNWYGGTVMRSSVAQPAATLVATSPGRPAGIALDDSHVFWTAWESSKVFKAPIGGGSPQQLAVDQNSPFGMAVDATAIYWSSYGNGTIMKLAR